jgi:hypothetical protein
MPSGDSFCGLSMAANPYAAMEFAGGMLVELQERVGPLYRGPSDRTLEAALAALI